MILLLLLLLIIIIRAKPNLPTNKIPAKICRLNISRNSPTDMRFPPLQVKILLQSNPPKSRILVRRLAVPWVMRTGRSCRTSYGQSPY